MSLKTPDGGRCKRHSAAEKRYGRVVSIRLRTDIYCRAMEIAKERRTTSYRTKKLKPPKVSPVLEEAIIAGLAIIAPKR